MKKTVGLKALQKALNKTIALDNVKQVVKQNGAELQQKIQRNGEATQEHQEGGVKQSVSLKFMDKDMTVEAENCAEHSEYQEFGTRFIEAQPFAESALREQAGQFIKDMKKLTK